MTVAVIVAVAVDLLHRFGRGGDRGAFGGTGHLDSSQLKSRNILTEVHAQNSAVQIKSDPD